MGSAGVRLSWAVHRHGHGALARVQPRAATSLEHTAYTPGLVPIAD